MTKALSPGSFLDAFVKMVPVFDAEIISQIRLPDSWIGNVTYGVSESDNWFNVREEVRKISEGLAYIPSRRPKRIPVGLPTMACDKVFSGVKNGS